MSFAIIHGAAADIVTVPVAALIETMRLFDERMKIIVEPTGCLAATVLFSGAVQAAAQRIGVIVSGGNMTWPGH